MALTLHLGDAEASFEEHPIEIARKALIAAAELESPDWSAVMLRFASALPPRGRLIQREEA